MCVWTTINQISSSGIISYDLFQKGFKHIGFEVDVFFKSQVVVLLCKCVFLCQILWFRGQRLLGATTPIVSHWYTQNTFRL